MAKAGGGDHDVAQALLRTALALPGTAQALACKGTALESTTVSVGGKNFLFVRSSEARLKLADARAEAEALAREDPEHYAIGAGGWALIRYGDGTVPPKSLLARWVKESHATIGGGAGAGPAPARKKAPPRRRSQG